MQIHNAVITGSFSYNGADLSNVTSSNAYSASLSSRTTDLETTSSVLVGASSSFSSILTSVSSSQQQISASLLNVIAVYATTGSNSFRATQSITGSLTVTGQIVAQSLNVQQVTSSIVFSSGSNTFGCDLNNRQTFTGSVLMTGSLNVFGNISSSGNLRIDKDQPDIQLNILSASQFSRVYFFEGASGNGGVQLIGSSFTGPRKCRFEIFGNNAGISFVANGQFENPGIFITGSNVGIGTTTPGYTLDVNGSGGFSNSVTIARNANSLTRLITSNTTAGANAYIETTFISDTSSGASAIGKYSSATNTYKIIAASNTFLYNNTVAGDIAILNDFTSGAIKMAAGGSCTSHLTIASTGNTTFSCNITAGAAISATSTGVDGTFSPSFNALYSANTAYYGTIAHSMSSVAIYSGFRFLGGGKDNLTGAAGQEKMLDLTRGQIILYTADTPRMYISSDGNAGIGTTGPGSKLDINQLGGDSARTCHALYLRAGNNSDVFNSNQILFSYNGSTDYAHAIKTRHNSNNAIDNAFDFYTWRYGDAAATKAGQYVMTIAGNGRVGIGSCQPAKPLSVWPAGGIGVYSNNTYSPTISLDFNNGTNIGHLLADQNAYYIRTLTSYPIYIQANAANGVYLSVGATSFTSNSDERLKNITGFIDNAVDKLQTLRTVKYSWKSDTTNKENLGLIAQDVEQIFPEVIDKSRVQKDDDTDYLGVRYQELIPVLVKAIQELKEENDIFKSCLGIS